MKKQFSLVLSVVLIIGLAFLPARADTAKQIRKQLKANYAKIVEGFKNNDSVVWESFLTPDFQLKLFNGAVQDRKWVVDYVRNNSKTFKIQKLSMKIQELTIEGDDVIAVVEQKSSRTFDEQGKPHQLDVGALQKETWTKTSSGWMLKHVQEWKVLYLLKDGKPMPH